VELPERETQNKALEDLRALSTEAEFAYISQRRVKDGNSFAYRTRVGFFGTEKKAGEFIAKKKAAGLALMGDSKAVKIDTFEETLPGQNLRLGKPVPGEPYTEPPVNHDKSASAKVSAPTAAESKGATKTAAPTKGPASAPAKSSPGPRVAPY
jgi:hypothetical protein